MRALKNEYSSTNGMNLEQNLLYAAMSASADTQRGSLPTCPWPPQGLEKPKIPYRMHAQEFMQLSREQRAEFFHEEIKPESVTAGSLGDFLGEPQENLSNKSA